MQSQLCELQSFPNKKLSEYLTNHLEDYAPNPAYHKCYNITTRRSKMVKMHQNKKSIWGFLHHPPLQYMFVLKPRDKKGTWIIK